MSGGRGDPALDPVFIPGPARSIEHTRLVVYRSLKRKGYMIRQGRIITRVMLVAFAVLAALSAATAALAASPSMTNSGIVVSSASPSGCPYSAALIQGEC
jgi:hypothetical protein